MHINEPTPVKDRTGAVIGSIERLPNGDEILRNNSDEVRGYYDAEADVTRDENKSIVAKGNKLRSMVC